MLTAIVQKMLDVRIPCQSMPSILLLLILPLVAMGPEGSQAARYSRRHCRGFDIEVYSDRGVKIEPLSQSRVEIALITLSRNRMMNRMRNRKNRFSLQLEFKTTAPNGTLFYGRSPNHPDELLAISLQKGMLVYTIRCSTLHADLVVPTRTRQPLNDGQWHSINYTVKNSPPGSNEIEIDGYSNFKRYEVTCAPIKSIVLGGLSPKDSDYVSELKAMPGHFDGCIRNLHTPFVFRKPPKYYAVSVCD